MTTKTQYNNEQESAILAMVEGVETYTEQRETIEILAEELGKTVRSVTAKVSSLAKAGKCTFIKKPTVKGEANTKPADKAVIVGYIAEAINVNVEIIETLEKANKLALQKVYNFINNQVLELEQEAQIEQ